MEFSKEQLEKCKEYMQIAALVCMDLDVLVEMTSAYDENTTVEDVVRQIKYIHKKKEEIINDKEIRESRYGASCLIFGAVASGNIQCSEIN